MFLGGLRHGASWIFVLRWVYHGFLILLYKSFQRGRDNLSVSIQRWLTFFLVALGWLVFRSTSLDMAITWFQTLLLWNEAWVFYLTIWKKIAIWIIWVSFILTTYCKNIHEIEHNNTFRRAIILAILFFICIILINNVNSPFLYYQF
jgi:alginate O-acetyltransferase complex protein AlgI